MTERTTPPENPFDVDEDPGKWADFEAKYRTHPDALSSFARAFREEVTDREDRRDFNGAVDSEICAIVFEAAARKHASP